MSRILGIELRRSAAGPAAILLVIGVLLLFFAEESDFTTGWIPLAMTQRRYLALLWPLALAAGAWQATREHRSNVAELFACTPRPRPQRTAPTVGAMAVAVVCAYLAMGFAGGLRVVGNSGYLPVQTFVVVAVGALALVAAAWFGLAVGRLLPSPVTAPALGVAGLALLLFIPFLTRPRGWLALVFSPITEMNMTSVYQTVPLRVSVAQSIWLTALAVTAVLLFASSSWRTRMAAVLPVAVGVALAITVMPHQKRLVYDAIDPVAMELVCADGAPRVCVSRVNSGRLDEVTPKAREGLAVLAKLSGAPTRVHEDTTTYGPDIIPPWQNDVVLLRIEVGSDGHLADQNSVAAQVVIGAFDSPFNCDRRAGLPEQYAAGYWLMGREPVALGDHPPDLIAVAVELWRGLGQLPAGEADRRVAALRQAAVACTVGEDPLSGGTR
jgi:hypothetical protein